MISRLRRDGVVLAGVFFACLWTFGDELRIGMGYGEQVGFSEYTQNNAVVDVLYDFYTINHGSWQLSFGTGLSWLWNDFDDTDVLIGSINPTLRFCLGETEYFKPYLFATTGFAYLTKPQLGHQLLGGYFAFNDYFGAGTYVGRERRWSVSACWRHISNAGLFSPNQGIDVPLCLLVGRTF